MDFRKLCNCVMCSYFLLNQPKGKYGSMKHEEMWGGGGACTPHMLEEGAEPF